MLLAEPLLATGDRSRLAEASELLATVEPEVRMHRLPRATTYRFLLASTRLPIVSARVKPPSWRARRSLSQLKALPRLPMKSAPS